MGSSAFDFYNASPEEIVAHLSVVVLPDKSPRVWGLLGIHLARMRQISREDVGQATAAINTLFPDEPAAPEPPRQPMRRGT